MLLELAQTEESYGVGSLLSTFYFLSSTFYFLLRTPYKVVLELAQTEESYGEALQLVVSTLVEPSLAGEILSQPQVAKL